ncbi:hypothetical protein MKQ70_20805 [Chitinophaga sedimenti]|uniref:hypothetical protein n=1 Tax=Chitinophaga sedimenti TaxID=2033606 RepID=UPI002006D826|nr:hypothetical protein [Chitinophaga sedimenti]MCK7557311.1 hypothetical protein [Chitinophaga sedimenti]
MKVIRGDDYTGGFEATSHLISKGCKDIVFIGGPLSCSLYTERLSGYKAALQENKIAFKKQRIFFFFMS